MEEGTRIFRLGNSVGSESAPRPASFEEAFGEFSEIRGRGRARRERRRDERAARKVRKQERKGERKIARQTRKDDVTASKQERRSARKQRRGTMRIGRRAERKAMRQQMRADQQAARMARRMERKRQQQDRRDLVADREMDRDIRMAQGQMELDQYSQRPQDAQGGYADEGGYAEGGYVEEGGYSQGGYADEGGGAQGGYAEQGGYSQGGYADEESYGDEGGYDDEYGDEGDYEDYGDGDYDYEDDYGFGDEFEDGEYNFEGETGVDEEDTEAIAAQAIADKIEWNKKLIQKLSADGTNSEAINARNERIAELKCDMRDFVCFDGEFFDDYEEEFVFGADGKKQLKPMDGDIYRRMQKAQQAKVRARRKAGFSQGRGLGRVNRPTAVQRGLGAQIEQNRIVVPASSQFNGGGTCTGITAIDAANDYGYAPTEIKLGFGGSESGGKLKLGEIVLGVGIGVAAIYLLKATKVL